MSDNTMDIFTPENRKLLLKTINYKMPFGKYKDRKLIELPDFYLVWFSKKGFPAGELGNMMQIMYEIKINGLEPIMRKLII